MPRNNQGVYTLPAGNPVVPGTLIETTWANPTMSDIAAALTGSLPRDGSAPMAGPLILATSNPTNPLEAASKAYVQSFMVYATGMPVGAAMPFLGNAPPPGFLVCDGQAVSRTTYAELFAVIGTIYGAGDGVLTFNVPDLRNQFIRGKADDRAVGSLQAGSFASHIHPVSDPGHTHGVSASQAAHSHVITTGSHNHNLNDPGHSHARGFDITGGFGVNAATAGSPWQTNTGVSGTGISIDGVGNLGGSADSQQPAVTVSLASSTTGETVGAAGGTETVPQNMALIYVVKALNDTSQTASLVGIDSSDVNMISVDNTNPAVPELVIHSNVAFGTVKLDGGGKLPLSLLPTSSVTMMGYFDASGGQNPSEAYPTQNFSAGNTYVVSVGGSITVFDPITLVASLTAVSAGNLLQYITGSLTNPTGWYYATQVTTFVASQVGFSPDAGLTSTNVQAAIVEVQSNVVATQGMIPTTASQIGFVPEGTIAATNVQAAIAELDSETQAALAGKASIGGVVTQTSATGAAHMPVGTQAQRPSPEIGMMRFNSDLVGFEGFNGVAWSPIGAGNASSIAFTPVGNIQATNVQSAIAEVDAEKLPLTGGTLSGALTVNERVNCRGLLLNAGDPAGATFDHTIWKSGVGGSISLRDTNGTVCGVNVLRATVNNPSGESQVQVGAAAYVYGNAAGTIIGMYNPNGSGNVYLQTDGNFISNGNVTALSDRRVKKNLEIISSALDKVQVLTGYTFDRLDCEMRQTGLIAQDVQSVLPEAVGVSEVDDLLVLNYGAMMGLIVEAIKELRAEVAALKGA